MPRSSPFSPEVRERAIRLVVEQTPSHGSQWTAVRSVAAKLGCHPETLRTWVRRQERDTGQRPGLSTSDATRLKALERENRGLRRANEILSKAPVDSRGQRNRAANRSAGLSNPGFLRGRVLSCAATASRWS